VSLGLQRALSGVKLAGTISQPLGLQRALNLEIVIRDIKPTIHLYLVSLGLQRALSGDEVVRDMKVTILLYLVSEGP
jgi:hypothetical protein